MFKSVMFYIYLIIAITILDVLFRPTDSTDVSRWNRSGMTLYTDNLTKCQYLKGGWFGGITPRLDARGEPLCK